MKSGVLRQLPADFARAVDSKRQIHEMHDFYYTRLLDDPTKFRPREGNKFIEMLEKEDGSVNCIEDDLDEVEIPSWLDGPTSSCDPSNGNYRPQKSSLRLLIGAPEEHHSDAKILPLPISRSTFETVRIGWNMPTELLRMMLSSLPLAIPFTTTNSAGQALKGLMVRGGRSRDWNFCLAIVHNPVEGSTVGIVNGMQENEVQVLLTCLKQSKEHVRDPMLLPIFLLELKVHYFAVLLEKRAVGIEEIEYATGMRRGFSQDPQRYRLIDKESKEKLKTLDFHPITQKLTGVTGTLGFCDMTFKSSQTALELVATMRGTLGLSYVPVGTDRENETARALGRRIEYLQELITGSQALGDVLAARTKAQVQTVYSLIGQRDNKVNIETAIASREISAISLLHNTAMKVLAEESRNIAILTRRDSTDMRIIAAVTLVFLPGTFIATIFGTNLFQFFPHSSGQMVSKWIWLYWVLTVVVTIVVLLIWWQFLRDTESHRTWRSATHSTPPPLRT